MFLKSYEIIPKNVLIGKDKVVYAQQKNTIQEVVPITTK